MSNCIIRCSQRPLWGICYCYVTCKTCKLLLTRKHCAIARIDLFFNVFRSSYEYSYSAALLVIIRITLNNLLGKNCYVQRACLSSSGSSRSSQQKHKSPPGSIADSFYNARPLFLRPLAQENVQKPELYASTLDRISQRAQQFLRHCPLQEAKLQTAKLPVPASELTPIPLPILVAKTLLVPVPAYSVELVNFTYCLRFVRLSILSHIRSVTQSTYGIESK